MDTYLFTLKVRSSGKQTQLTVVRSWVRVSFNARWKYCQIHARIASCFHPILDNSIIEKKRKVAKWAHQNKYFKITISDLKNWFVRSLKVLPLSTLLLHDLPDLKTKWKFNLGSNALSQHPTLNLFYKSLVFFIFHYLHKILLFIPFILLTFHISFFLYITLFTRHFLFVSVKLPPIHFLTNTQTYTHTLSLSLPLPLSLPLSLSLLGSISSTYS